MRSKAPQLVSGGQAPGEAVQAALERLLDQDQLKLSNRNKRFLRFVVSEALAGRGDRIKAYTIGVDVFGRGANFDPSNDPIVRIEATRIRTALSIYYEKHGSREPVKILIPPGSYVPTFEIGNREEVSASSAIHCAIADASNIRPAIIITVRTAPGAENSDFLIELLKQSVAARLLALGARVFLTPWSRDKGTAQSAEQLSRHLGCVYALDGALYSMVDNLLQTWRLTDLGTGELLNATLEAHSEKDVISAGAIAAVADKAARMIEDTLALGPRRGCCAKRS